MTIDWQQFAEIIKSNDRFLLTSHVRPDCDALGSELGMAGVLEQLGKEVLIVNSDATPPNIAFIDPQKKIKQLGEDISVEQLADIQVLIVLDTSAWIQLGRMDEVVKTTKAKKLIVDHHVSEDDLGAISFKNTNAEAAGRLVVEAADALGVKLTPEIARPLFAALATDTGWYRFSSVHGDTYKLASRLVDAGASPAEIYGQLYEQETLPRTLLKGVVLSRIESECDGRFVHTYARQSDFEKVNALPSDTENLVNQALAISGTDVAIFLVEQPSGSVKCSFRSRNTAFDCSQVASKFGGGGHRAAAGATLDGPFESARDRLLQHVRASM